MNSLPTLTAATEDGCSPRLRLGVLQSSGAFGSSPGAEPLRARGQSESSRGLEHSKNWRRIGYLVVLQIFLIGSWSAPLIAAEVKRIPPPGVAIPEDARAELTAGVASLGKEIESLRTALAGKPKLLALLPDVQIFHKAVDWALRYDEFFDVKQVEAARRQLALGNERAKALRESKAPWEDQTGLVVRGYFSGIDGSIQPYGLVVPEDRKPGDRTPIRTDFWLHGRGEKLSELAFLEDRMKNRGEFAPPNAITVHLYERFCNANHFAGEMDLFEALASVRQHFPVDPNRIVVRGFSMGGASCWDYATHHAGLWVATSPGAGFAETAEFFKSFAPEKTPPPWWEQVLWRWYDATDYAGNLANTTMVAYSGEIDGQKQSADIMERYMTKEGLTLQRVIGAKMGHKYDAESKTKIEELMTAAADKGRNEFPAEVKFTTYTLIYSHMKWVQVDGLAKQWERADIDAKASGDQIEATTKNVTGLLFTSPLPGAGAEAKIKQAVLDGQTVPAQWKDGRAAFHREGDQWAAGPLPTGLRKNPTVCGPIDHAFMAGFVMVRPTGKPLNATVGAWTKSEMEHALTFWRQVYRGEAVQVDDHGLTEKDLSKVNLILWGDPSSNAVLAKILPKLPIQWTAEKITVGKNSYPAGDHAPIFIFPNPLSPQHYVVINSGVTFREKALLNNSDQTPKLPDWAVVDLRTPPDAETPGLVVDAGFFDENWQLPK